MSTKKIQILKILLSLLDEILELQGEILKMIKDHKKNKRRGANTGALPFKITQSTPKPNSPVAFSGPLDFAFTKGYRMYIMYMINNHDQLKQAISARLNIWLNGNRSKLLNDLHITLFDFSVNLENPDHKFFQDESFRIAMVNAFNTALLGTRLINDPNGGKTLGPYFAATYKLSEEDKGKITQFRTAFYKCIEKNFGEKLPKPILRKGWWVFKVNGKELFAIAHYQRGLGNWLAHISMLHLNSLQIDNHELYKSMETYIQNKKDDKIQARLNAYFGTKKFPFPHYLIFDGANNMKISASKNTDALNWCPVVQCSKLQ